MPGPLHATLLRAAGKSKRLRFDEFQRIALYDPAEGYFAKDAKRAGRGGDFLTAPEVSPLFAECIAHALMADSIHLGATEHHILEVGAGRGTLVRDLWDYLRLSPVAERVRFHLVEVSAAARASQPATLADLPRDRWTSYASVDDLPHRPWPSGSLVANELFDNLPVRRLMMTKRLEEIVVHVTPQRIREELVEAPVELQAFLEAQGIRLAVGQTAEVCPEAPQLLSRVLPHFRRGSVLIVDYGDEAKRLYDASRFPHGTLAAHRAHGTHTNFYGSPGDDDLTAHVNFTPLLSVLEAGGYRTTYFGSQMKFLLEHGLPDALERRQRSARDEFERLRWNQWAKQLYHPEAMGEAFRVLHARST